MSKFEVKVYRLEIEEHPNADVIELAKVGDYRSIVRKGQFQTGDLGVYIPEAAIVPDWLISELGLEGKLAGKDKNRVKAVKLRGILSQGLIVPLTPQPNGQWWIKFNAGENGNKAGIGENFYCPYGTLPVEEGADVADLLCITKWEPPIPVHMNGEIFNAFGYTLKYDIENIKRYPDAFEEGDDVSITEKIHGTWCCMGFHPDLESPIVTSKGFSEKGLAFKFNEANKDNLYIRAYKATTDNDNATAVMRAVLELAALETDTPVYLLGEIFGPGVQDFLYGKTEPQFRLFDVYIGEPGQGKYLDAIKLPAFAKKIGVESVPVLYTGIYSKEIVELYTSGDETVSGDASHMREGIVIKPTTERRDVELGRLFLKSVSEAYILRKNKNATEYQ